MAFDRRSWLAAMCAVCAALVIPGAQAQGRFPTQPIRLVVPYPPGGSTDNIARLYADGLAKQLGQPVIVDNRPGAATNIGSEMVAKAKPDGYTLLFGGSVLTLNSVFGPKPLFDPRTALASVSTVAQVPFMVAANPKVPFNNPQELVTAARKAPGQFSVSSAQLDVYVEQLELQADADLLHIPYKGGAQATSDAIGGQVQAVFALVPVLLPQVKAGKLRAVGVTSEDRLTETLPSVPTFMESGVNYVTTVWYGLQAPAGLPAELLSLLNESTQKVVTSKTFVSKLSAMGAGAKGSTPQEMDQQLAELKKTWQDLAAANPKLMKVE